jgi:hypothetical protein
MKSQTQLVVNPSLVPANASLTIQRTGAVFSDSQYFITKENGDLVRKGKIADTSRDFSLSVGGMPDGSYYFVMGNERERFTIV